MDIAKITSKGQITIPVDIRRRLKLKDGDKVLFVEDGGKIFIVNASMDALYRVQKAFTGEAERTGIMSEQDVVDMTAEIRRERMNSNESDA